MPVGFTLHIPLSALPSATHNNQRRTKIIEDIHQMRRDAYYEHFEHDGD
jgi:hypothetical protein